MTGGLEARVNDIYLGSRDIKRWITEGRLRSNSPIGNRVQPASYEPCIGTDCYLITNDSIPKPTTEQTVYRALLEHVSGSRREKKTVYSTGLVLHPGFSYLFPLEDTLKVEHGMRIDASPKSSWGRAFPCIRLLSDYNDRFDEIPWYNRPSAELKLWLLVQPQAFSLTVKPGYTLNQLRIGVGNPRPLTPEEILFEHARNPLVYELDDDGKPRPIDPVITDTLEVRIDTQGKHTHGIVGFRARRTPDPLDPSQPNSFNVEKYFDPIEPVGGKILFEPDNYYIITSDESIVVPDHLNIIIPPHSPAGVRGETHFAGFFDPGWAGQGTFEYYCKERGPITLAHRMPISKALIYRSTEPEQAYGEGIGSSYKHQVGARLGKCFKVPDFEVLAGKLDKLKYSVMVNERAAFETLRKLPRGFEPLPLSSAKTLCDIVASGWACKRDECEDDEAVLQPIPYVVLFGPDGTVFRYRRSSDRRHYGDARLGGKWSIGVGGHIRPEDGPDHIHRCMMRELDEEVSIGTTYIAPMLAGTMLHDVRPIDRVHFGLIYTMHVGGDVKHKPPAQVEGSFVPIKELESAEDLPDTYETWSYGLVPHLASLYKLR